MKEHYLLSISILISFTLLALAILYSFSQKDEIKETILVKDKKVPALVNLKTDHIDGNTAAKIFIIEYSDLECHFCKEYNDNSLRKLKEKFKKSDDVAFVFRNMPVTSIHPSAFAEATALECASELGGNKKFFEYKDKVFSETNSDGNFSYTRLSSIADEIGIDKDDFKTCILSEHSKDKVTKSFEEGRDAGVRGTPSIYIQLNKQPLLSIPADYTVINNSITSYLSISEK